MPNWCSTKYVAFTDCEDKSELKRLHDNLTSAMQTPSVVENGFGEGWLGDIALKHGLNWEDIPCRGTIEHLDEYDEDSVSFSFATETAWEQCDELWDAVISQYEGVSHVYISEELGNAHFVNSDIEGRFLPEKFLLDMWGNGSIPDGWYAERTTKPVCLDEREYFVDFEALANHCAKITGRAFASLEELRNYFDNIFDEDANIFANIHEFEAA